MWRKNLKNVIENTLMKIVNEINDGILKVIIILIFILERKSFLFFPPTHQDDRNPQNLLGIRHRNTDM